MKLSDIRTRYPQYNDLSDDQLVDAFHSAYYADMPREEVARSMGVEGSSLLRRAGDVGISALKGAISVPEAAVGLIDIPTGGWAGKAAEQMGFRPKEAKAILDEYLTPEQQAANRAVSEAEGFGGTVKAALQNPSVIGHTVVESLPSMAAGGVVGRGIASATKAAPWMAGAIGEGVIGAGSAAETTRQNTDDGLLTAGQSAAALASGAGSAAFGAAGARVAQKLGIADVDTLLAGGGSKLNGPGVIRRIVAGGISEGMFEELPQSAQEQVWQNAALGKPLMQGVPEAAGLGFVTGAAMGGIASGAFPGREPVQAPPAKTVDDILKSGSVEESIENFNEVVSESVPRRSSYEDQDAISTLERTAEQSALEKLEQSPRAVLTPEEIGQQETIAQALYATQQSAPAGEIVLPEQPAARIESPTKSLMDAQLAAMKKRDNGELLSSMETALLKLPLSLPKPDATIQVESGYRARTPLIDMPPEAAPQPTPQPAQEKANDQGPSAAGVSVPDVGTAGGQAGGGVLGDAAAGRQAVPQPAAVGQADPGTPAADPGTDVVDPVAAADRQPALSKTAPSTAKAATVIVEIKDVYGRMHRVRKDDLDGNSDRIPTVRKSGEVVVGEELPRSIIAQPSETKPPIASKVSDELTPTAVIEPETPAEQAPSLGREVSRYAGMYKKGMTEFNAKREANLRNRTQKALTWVVENAEEEFGSDRHVIVGYEKPKPVGTKSPKNQPEPAPDKADGVGSVDAAIPASKQEAVEAKDATREDAKSENEGTAKSYLSDEQVQDFAKRTGNTPDNVRRIAEYRAESGEKDLPAYFENQVRLKREAEVRANAEKEELERMTGSIVIREGKVYQLEPISSDKRRRENLSVKTVMEFKTQGVELWEYQVGDVGSPYADKKIEAAKKAGKIVNTDAEQSPTPPDVKTVDDRDTFTLDRTVESGTGEIETVTFKRGEYVKAFISKGKWSRGEIEGISQARREAKVNGVWFDFFSIYKDERPVKAKPKTVALSSVLEKVNAKNGGDLTDADRVPGADAGEVLGKQSAPSLAAPFDQSLYNDIGAGKSSRDILARIAKESDNALNREIAQAMLDAGVNPKIGHETAAGKRFLTSAPQGYMFAAAYSPKTDTVMLFQPAEAERNVLHEFVHAGTFKALRKDGMHAAQMKRMFAHVEKSGKAGDAYGMSNVDEFTAEALSNPEFQEVLRGITKMPTGSKFQNAWEWFVDLVRRAIGLPTSSTTALDQALSYGRGMMLENGGKAEGSGLLGNVSKQEFERTDLYATHFDSALDTEIDVDGESVSLFNAKDGTIVEFWELPKNAQKEMMRQVGGDILPGENVRITQAGKDDDVARVHLDILIDENTPYINDGDDILGSVARDTSKLPESKSDTQASGAWMAPESSTFFGIKKDDFIYALQDKQIDTKRVVQAIRKAVGTIEDKWNPYLQEELFHGRSAKAVKDFLGNELKPLLQDMQLRGVDIAEFEEYLHNRHAEERNNQIAKVNPKMSDGGSGIDTADARAYLANLPVGKKKAFEALAKKVDAIGKGTKQLLVAAGLETQETVDAWDAAYQYYIPLQREESGAGIGQGFSVRGSASKRAMGSKKSVIDIMANIAMQRERAIVRAEKNRVATALYGLAITQPNPDFWLPVNPDNPGSNVAQELTNLGMNPIDAKNLIDEPTQQYIDPRTGLVAERVNPMLRSGRNVLSVRVNGKDRYVFFNENDERAMRMVATLKNLDADQLGRLLSLSAKVTRFFSSINTQYNPVFGAINLIRDTQGAMLNLSTTEIAGKQREVMAHTLSALRGIYIDLRDHRAGKKPTSSWAAEFEEFQNEGGQTGYRNMFSTSAERANAIKRELAMISEGKAKAGVRAVFDWLSDYNETMENAVRLAAYKVAKEQGMSKQQAASLAKNLTVNFNRKGQIATQAGAMYAFFNAAVQGTTRLAQTLRGPAGKKIITGGLLLGSVQALLLAAAGFDDGEPPDFVKDRNLIIPLKDGKYLTVPMPLGFNIIPNISRITTEFALGGFKNPTKHLAHLIDQFADTFNPIGNAGFSLQTITPTAIDPLAALTENRDWTGKPIAKEDSNSLAPTPGYVRAKDTASAISKTLSYWINLASGGTKYTPGLVSPTPDQLDYLIGQATGGVGREALKIEQTVTSTITGEELPPNKVPFFGRFYGDTKGQSGISSRFYDNLKALNVHEAEIKGRRKDRGDVMGYLRDNPDARFVNLANDAERDIQRMKKQKRELLEKDAPKERVKLKEQQITTRMKRFNDRVDELRAKQADK